MTETMEVIPVEQTGKKQGVYYLMCERTWVFFTLTAVGGFFGAYTYLLRGHVFCNAQTGNIVLMGLALGSGRWRDALYYLIPISAYLLGAFLSELVPDPIKHRLFIRWDTLLIAIEMLVVAGLGLLPDAAPAQISQVAVNFIASMQYNTFRQAEGVPISTTFATNHIRQVGVGLAKEFKHRRDPEKPYRARTIRYAQVLLVFAAGVSVGALCCGLLAGRAIWVTLIPLMVVFCALLPADLTVERDLLEEKPAGH